MGSRAQSALQQLFVAAGTAAIPHYRVRSPETFFTYPPPNQYRLRVAAELE